MVKVEEESFQWISSSSSSPRPRWTGKAPPGPVCRWAVPSTRIITSTDPDRVFPMPPQFRVRLLQEVVRCTGRSTPMAVEFQVETPPEEVVLQSTSSMVIHCRWLKQPILSSNSSKRAREEEFQRQRTPLHLLPLLLLQRGWRFSSPSLVTRCLPT